MTTDANTDLLNQIAAQLKTLSGQPPATTGWGAPPVAPPAPPTGLIQGVAAPIVVDTPLGEVRCYLSLPADVAQSPQSLMAAIQALASLGIPLAARTPRPPWNGNGGGGGGDWSRGPRWRSDGPGYRASDDGGRQGNAYGRSGGYGSGGYRGGYRSGGHWRE